MRVGVLTFANTNNYGAELQAYALRQTIERLGHDAELVGYRNPQVSSGETPRLPTPAELVRAPKGAVSRALKHAPLSQRHRAFERFRTARQKTGPLVTSQRELAERYDALVVGSDQVWNPTITGADETYLLPEVDPRRTAKVAYAASFGYPTVPPTWARSCMRALPSFRAIGVREDEGARIVRALTGRRAEVVLDPTLLLDARDWEKVTAPRVYEGRYVFTYVVQERGLTLSLAREAARRLGARLVRVECYRPLPTMRCLDASGASIEEFLSLVRHAELVVTSSFHGLALSLALGTEARFVLSSDANNKNSRITTLARVAGVENHDALGASLASTDWDRVRERLGEARGRSLAFLREALGAGAP